MNFSGILTAGISFLVIGIFHPIVIWAEYYFTKRCWPVFLRQGGSASDFLYAPDGKCRRYFWVF